MSKKILLLLYLAFYTAFISFSVGVFYIFRPYQYVDNNKSLIVCHNSNITYETGTNFIYAFDQKLDSFNDVKARKLCKYSMIKDYGDTLKTPETVNYRFEPKYITDSSWADAVFMFFATLIIGIIAIETLNLWIFRLSPNLKAKMPVLSFFWEVRSGASTPTKAKNTVSSFAFFVIYLSMSFLLFFFFFKKPVAKVFCARQIARKVNNFKRIIFRYGVFPIPEEDTNINSIVPSLYEKCLKNEV